MIKRTFFLHPMLLINQSVTSFFIRINLIERIIKIDLASAVGHLSVANTQTAQ
jgi:hypothetical protein